MSGGVRKVLDVVRKVSGICHIKDFPNLQKYLGCEVYEVLGSLFLACCHP